MEILAHPWELAVLCFATGFLLARSIYVRRPKAVSPARTDIGDAEIEAQLRTGQKIEAIKLCRQKYGYDLKTALDEINAKAVKLGIHI